MEKGDIVEDFELLDQTNTTRRLSDLLLNGPVVLLFYPAAMTKGCTAESCHFRDLAAEFGAVGAQRVGISIDGVAKQKQFSDKHEFDYPLLSDPDQKVAKSLGVARSISLLPTKRVTFVIDSQRVILARISSELRMNAHADQALDVLRNR